MNTFLASDIEILRFSNEPDTTGIIVPEYVIGSWPKSIKVMYGSDDTEAQIGTAILRKTGNILLADMVLKSSMKDLNKALGLMQKLYPAVEFNVTEYTGNTVLKLFITQLFLTPYVNDDAKIMPLGARVILKPERSKLH